MVTPTWRESLKRTGEQCAALAAIGALAASIFLLLNLDTPPWAAQARVLKLAQSVEQLQRQVAIGSYATLSLQRDFWQTQLDDANDGLVGNPNDRAARRLKHQAEQQLRFIDVQLLNMAKQGNVN